MFRFFFKNFRLMQSRLKIRWIENHDSVPPGWKTRKSKIKTNVCIVWNFIDVAHNLKKMYIRELWYKHLTSLFDYKITLVYFTTHKFRRFFWFTKINQTQIWYVEFNCNWFKLKNSSSHLNINYVLGRYEWDGMVSLTYRKDV